MASSLALGRGWIWSLFVHITVFTKSFTSGVFQKNLSYISFIGIRILICLSIMHLGKTPLNLSLFNVLFFSVK